MHQIHLIFVRFAKSWTTQPHLNLISFFILHISILVNSSIHLYDTEIDQVTAYHSPDF